MPRRYFQEVPHPDPRRTRARWRRLRATAIPEPESLAEEVRRGLSSKPLELPCRFLYDAEGSRLFEEICDLDEYYLTRTERKILRTHAPAMIDGLPTDAAIVEFGSGNASKTRLLLEAAAERQEQPHFVPIDISPTALDDSAEDLLGRYPWLRISTIEADYRVGLEIASQISNGPKLVLWLGSSIGNLTVEEAVGFLCEVREKLREEDRLLVGMDLKKSPAVMERAYDDARGVTARFNKNLLERVNRELDADFELDQFEHRAVWEPEQGAVVSSLVSRCDQAVEIAKLELELSFSTGDSIHTENSHKYSQADIDTLVGRAGLRRSRQWLDEDGLFSVNELRLA